MNRIPLKRKSSENSRFQNFLSKILFCFKLQFKINNNPLNNNGLLENILQPHHNKVLGDDL